MFSDAITQEDLTIRIHHIGGSGSYGPAGVLSNLGDVEWIVYDADQTALSRSRLPESGKFRLVSKCIGGTNSQAKFYTTAVPTASSMLAPSPRASEYTKTKSDGTLRVWGKHAQIVKSVDVQVHALDWLVENGEVPPVDFLSIDAQGAELSIIDNASKMIASRALGVLCEVEFSELYDGQPLFCDTQNCLRKNQFRLCEIYSHQYLNTAPLRPELLGKGFLTVGEALFLKDVQVWSDEVSGNSIFSSIEDAVKALKLAAIAVAFDQLDYALGICKYLERKKLVSLERIADLTNVKYIRLLRDICHVADLIQNHMDHSPTEPLGYQAKSKSMKLRDRFGNLYKFIPIHFVITKPQLPGIVRVILRRAFRKKYIIKMFPISQILYKYGLEEIAYNQAMRSTMLSLASRRLTRFI